MSMTRVLILAVLAVVATAACSGAGASPSTPASVAPDSTAPESTAPADATIVLGDSSLGSILVDAEGNTLYGFMVDTEGVSACYDACEENWPPLLADGDVTVGEGLDQSLVTTVPRTDGSMQVKYGDWPLYRFAGDAATGDANGQGVNDVWFVVGADGALIETAAGRIEY
jgi:predicted lipoprotein with Yx(FWY)xxD motif